MRTKKSMLSLFAACFGLLMAIPTNIWAADSEKSDTSGQLTSIFIAVIIGIAVAIAVVVIVAILREKKFRSKVQLIRKRKLFNTCMGLGMSVITVAAAIGNYLALSTYKNSIDALFTTTENADADIETQESDWYELCYEIANQGMVLIKNENNTLPLDTSSGNTKINLLGYRAYDPIYSGSGSANTSSENAIDVKTALEDAGFEVNPACLDEGVYEAKEEEEKDIGFTEASFTLEEKSLDEYTGEASFEAMKEYSDTAIVVIGRTGGEGKDLTDFEETDGKNYLQLSDNEEKLLEKARETFDTLIVVYNGANTMEMGYLDTYDVDACVWAGIPGPNGFESLGKILNGSVNPSGKLVDTWAYDLNSAPSSENFGEQKADNADGYYVDYTEGIYVGYKWYETAYAENAVITNTKTGTTYDYGDYDSIVQFPFGYGLSYTTFSHKIVGGLEEGKTLKPDDEVTLEVEVENTGSVTGKDAVEVYVTAPYTDYDKENGVEKSEVSLVGYAKTGDIEPGEKETVNVTFKVEDIASYDSSCDNSDGTKGAYMLDEGDYTFSVRSDAHTVYDEVTVNVSEQHFYSGDAKRSSDDQAASNQFDDAARGVYLSRNNSFENYQEAMDSVSTSVESTDFDENPNEYDSSYDDVVDKEYKEGTDYAVDGNLTLADMEGLSYDDPQWDDFIKQLSIDDIQNLIGNALFGTAEVESIGKDKTSESDGPLGLASYFDASLTSVSYPCMPILAATFNDELAQKYGNYMADQMHNAGVSGWYAPSMNIHRNAFAGRNFEYYSEDAVLSAGIGANETYGAREKGLIVYIKHFALNEMETNRSGRLHTYSNEQAIREIYLKPFEKSVKDGNATGVMSSMNYIGDVYASASASLCTEVLRNEWGFRGRVVTDMVENEYMTDCADEAVRAGTDMWLAPGGVTVSSETDADIYYLQKAAKDILYTQANAQVIAAETANWQLYLYILDAEIIVLILLGAVLLVQENIKRKNPVCEK